MSSEVWNPPSDGLFKLNCDVAIFSGKGIGLGGVVCNHVGDPLMAFSELIEEEVDIECAEALAVKKGLALAWESGLPLDCQCH